MNRFTEHGEYKLVRHGNIFHLDMIGDWNKEQVLSFALHTKDVIAAVKLTRFSNLIVFRNFGITHDAIDMMNGVTEAAIAHGLEREALVTESSWTKQLAIEFGAKSRDNYERQVFENRDDALAWLLELYPENQ